MHRRPNRTAVRMRGWHVPADLHAQLRCCAACIHVAYQVVIKWLWFATIYREVYICKSMSPIQNCELWELGTWLHKHFHCIQLPLAPCCDVSMLHIQRPHSDTIDPSEADRTATARL